MEMDLLQSVWSFCANIDNEQLTKMMSLVMIIVSVIVYGFLMIVNAPYGRYSSSSWGPLIDVKLAWFVQELPSLIIPLCYVLYTDNTWSPNMRLLSLYILHYIQRALIYPLLIRGGKSTPLIPFLLALMFCLYNGMMQSLSLLWVQVYPDDWFNKPHVIFGVILFFTGMFINIHSDHILRNLRKPGEVGYKIPKGGLFHYISGANFFGEIVEWIGFAIACCSLPSLAFVIFAGFNLGPRALQHHQWYKMKFEDYPRHRKALIPFLL